MVRVHVSSSGVPSGLPPSSHPFFLGALLGRTKKVYVDVEKDVLERPLEDDSSGACEVRTWGSGVCLPPRKGRVMRCMGQMKTWSSLPGHPLFWEHELE